MKRPRRSERDKLVSSLQEEAPWVRNAWELGRLQRRAIADLRSLLERAVHYTVVPLRAGDPRVASAQLDRQLQASLRARGRFDEKGLIYGGETRVMVRPLASETVSELRRQLYELQRTLDFATFASPLEHAAFRLAPKDPSDDAGSSRDEQWHDAWLRITYGHCPKAIACEAIGLNENAYDERRRRPRAKAGNLSIRDQELLEFFQQEIDADTRTVESHREYRQHAAAIAEQRGQRLPKYLRVTPSYTRATRSKLPPDWLFLDNDRRRWATGLKRYRVEIQPTVRRLLKLREERLAGGLGLLEIHAWLAQPQLTTAGNPS